MNDKELSASNISNSTVNQAAGDIHNHYNGSQLTVADVVSLINAMVEPKLEKYQLIAQQTTRDLLDEYTSQMKLDLQMQVPDRLWRFAEPSLQYAAFRSALGYVKTGTEHNRESLIDLLIERVKVDEHTTDQMLIDEAIDILPKLSHVSLSILTILVFSHLTYKGTVENYRRLCLMMDPIVSAVVTAKTLDTEYLSQVNCLSHMMGMSSSHNWLQHIEKNCDALFNRFSQKAAAEFCSKCGITVAKEGTMMRLPQVQDDSQRVSVTIALFQLLEFNQDGTISSRLSSIEDLNKEFAQPLFAPIQSELYTLSQNVEKTSLSARQYFKNLNPNWSKAIDIIEYAHKNGYFVKPVGTYIGSRQLTKLLEVPIGMDTFYK